MSRRGQGEGSIFQLPSGRWRAMVDLGYINGRRCRKAKTCRTRAEAAGWLRAALRDHERGALVSRTPTVAEWLDTYLTNARSNNKVRPGTLDNYQRCAELHIKPVLGLVKLDALTPQRLSQFYATKMQQGTSAWTVRYVHAVLRRALKVAMRWGVIARNVATLVEPPPEPEHEVEPLTVTEARAFLAAAQHDRLEARWVVGLSLGLRQGETLGLRWDDIDFARRQLYVRRQLVRARGTGNGLAFAPLKSARSRRSLSLPPRLVELLQRHRRRQRAERLRAETWADTSLLFTTRKGQPIDHRNDTRAFKALLVAARVRCVEIKHSDGTVRLVPTARLHDLRHTAASLLLVQGVPARVVMDVLGHSQIGTTMNIYSHVMPGMLDEVAEAMGRALWTAEPDQTEGDGDAS